MSEHDDAVEHATRNLMALSRDDAELFFAAALRVWGNNRDREDWKEFASLGDSLFHLSGGAFGRCVKYDSATCLTEDEQRARYGATIAEIEVDPPGTIPTPDSDFGPLPPPVLGRLSKPYVHEPWPD